MVTSVGRGLRFLHQLSSRDLLLLVGQLTQKMELLRDVLDRDWESNP